MASSHAESGLRDKATAFIQRYAAHFSSSAANHDEQVDDLCRRIGQCYRAGITFFTNGNISRFESQEQAASLIAKEMRVNIVNGLGTCLILEGIEKIEVYSPGSAMCWLRWRFEPQKGSQFEERGWKFMNIYGYRAGDAPADGEDGTEGWEFVVRDLEASSMFEATGMRFDA